MLAEEQMVMDILMVNLRALSASRAVRDGGFFDDVAYDRGIEQP